MHYVGIRKVHYFRPFNVHSMYALLFSTTICMVELIVQRNVLAVVCCATETFIHVNMSSKRMCSKQPAHFNKL